MRKIVILARNFSYLRHKHDIQMIYSHDSSVGKAGGFTLDSATRFREIVSYEQWSTQHTVYSRDSSGGESSNLGLRN